MLGQVITIFYRIIATIIILTPMTFNVFHKGEIINSLLYLPLLTLFLTILFIIVDNLLIQILAWLSTHKGHKASNKRQKKQISSKAFIKHTRAS
ncbi:hypothetical protein GCM10025767_27610 [Thalassotalea piscium]|uniref:Putative Tic20 family protein n=1 Tax=Thalassotalea piscium TaxID=1230533 RepID=A0A7X0NJH9_9GAMM|nr:putative Tic20 family protein [Thalassotalea piscium]